MSTPESNEKSISKLQDDAVLGDGILGGVKAVPSITIEFNDTPMDVSMPGRVELPAPSIMNYNSGGDGDVAPVDTL